LTNVPLRESPSSEIVHSPPLQAISQCRRETSPSHGRGTSLALRRPIATRPATLSSGAIRCSPSPSR
jgi:hypothetical protein